MGVEITTLWPHHAEGTDLNRNSLVMRIRYCSATGIIMGDADSRVEHQLLENDALPQNIELLVAGHHGSANTSSTRLLQRLNPDKCVISVNTNNIRGYPDASTVKRLTSYCQQLLQTDKDGDIHVNFSASECGS